MADLDAVRTLLGREQGLVVISTLRAAGTIQSSLVNAGVMAHPGTGEPALAFVTYGPVKLANLRARPQVTLTVRSGWSWATVEGTAELIGPDTTDDAEYLRVLLREVFVAAGGTHDDWDEYDRVMREQGRTAVFVKPTRIYGT